MKVMKSIREVVNRKAPLLVPVALLGVGAAHAQSTGGSAAFNSAVQSASADIATYGAALVGVAAVGVVFMVAIKYEKKIRGAA
ncbi:hypothetical protein U6R35_12220 [Cutibacterium acnes]